jgi:hypothetical protein
MVRVKSKRETVPTKEEEEGGLGVLQETTLTRNSGIESRRLSGTLSWQS